MIIRTAAVEDIPGMQVIRGSVQENILSDPNRITTNDYHEFLTVKGAGWICETADQMVGFCIVDLKENNVWALFVHPDYQSVGIGQKLHDLMLDYYFQQTNQPIWLSTDRNTKAEAFYRKNGWQQTGLHHNEVKFELTAADWLSVGKP
jgi:ribosomal protein S18 acetylase RimI-like enzyme